MKSLKNYILESLGNREVEILKTKRLKEKGNLGWEITFCYVLSNNSVGSEKIQEVWIEDKEKAIKEFLSRSEFKLKK